MELGKTLLLVIMSCLFFGDLFVVCSLLGDKEDGVERVDKDNELLFSSLLFRSKIRKPQGDFPSRSILCVV